jgi:hypothetical protein
MFYCPSNENHQKWNDFFWMFNNQSWNGKVFTNYNSSSFIVSGYDYILELNVPGSPTVGMISRVKAMKRSGIDVISLGAGEPGFVTPEHIRDSAKKALDEGHTFYSDSAGLAELRIAIAEKTER